MRIKKLLLGLSLLLLSAAVAWGQCDADIYYQEANGTEINLSTGTPAGKNIFCNTDQAVYKLYFKPKNANAIIRNPTFAGAAVRQGATPGEYSFSVKDLVGKPTKDGEEYTIYLNYLDDKFTQKTCEAKIKVQIPLNLILTGLNQSRQYCQTETEEVTITVRKQPNDDIGNDDIPDGILEVIPFGTGAPLPIPKSGAPYKYTYKFKPSNYPPGAHILRFRSTKNDDYKCESVIETNFEITPDPGNPDIIVNGSAIGPNETRCIPANEPTKLTAQLAGQNLSVGVSFSGPSSGLVNKPDETTFDPRTAGPGPHTIVFNYLVGGCRVTRSFQLQPVNQLPNFSLASSAYLCADANPINLNPSPPIAGATFAITPAPGPGALVGNTLFPDKIASPVNPNTRYQIAYSGKLPDGCSFKVAKDFFLRAPKSGFPKFNFEKGLAFCTQDPPFAISVLPSGGKFQVIDPLTSVAIPGAIQTAGIQGDEKINFAPLAAAIPANEPFKKFILRYAGPIPADPEQDPCPYNGEIEFYVSKPPVPKLTLTQNVFAVCSANNARKFELTGNYDELAQNIAYSGPAVKKENGKWIFEPATAGDGLHVITYTVKVGSCQASAQDTVVVFNPPRVVIDERINNAEYCNSQSPIQFRMQPGGGNWSPAFLAAAITRNPSDPTLFTLAPSQMPVGSQTLNYSGNLDGCPFAQSVRINIKAGPQASIGGIAPVLCQSRGALQLNPQPAGGTLSIDPPISGALVGNILQVNVLPPAQYKLTYSGKDPLTGCNFSATATFRVGADPISASPQDIGLPAKICERADIVDLSRPRTPAGFPRNGVFSGPGIQSVDDEFTFDPLLAGPGVHVINYSGEIDGCPYTFAYRVEVPLTAIAVEPSAVTICRGQEATLKVIDILNINYPFYSWSPRPQRYLNNQDSEVLVSPGETTVYTVSAGSTSNPNQCPASATVTVRVVEPGAVNTRIQDVTQSGYWDGRVSATFDSLPAGRYRIVIENLDGSGSCRRETTVTVREPNCNNFNVSIAPGLAVCGGSGIVVQPQVTGGGGAYSYRWNPATGVSSTTSAAPIITPRQSTVYTLEVSDNASGCRKTLLVPINVLTPVDPSLIGLPTRLEVCAGSGVNLRAAGGSTYTWSPSEGLSATNTQSVVAAPAQTTTYFVEVSNGDARCSQKASVVVVVNALPQATVNINRASCPTCPDGSVRVISATATGYWLEGQNNNQYQSSPSFSGLRPGVYQYRVRDARGCESAIQTLTVTPLPPSEPTPPCDSPLAPIVTLQTQQNALQLSWNAVANATGYVVSICEENDPLVCPVERRAVSGTTLALPLSVFAEGKRYVARVQTVCGAAQSAFSNGSSFALPAPPPPACPAPRINENSYVETLSAAYRFFWESVAGAIGYELRICPVSRPNNCTIVTAATNAVLVSSANFIPGERYVIDVRTLCPNNIFSVYSNSVTLSLPGRCPIPTVTSISYRGPLVDIKWEAINEILPSGSYEVRICQANNPSVCIPGTPRSTNTHSLTIDGAQLIRGVEYAIEVRSRCSNGLVSEYSEPFRFTYNNPIPPICPPPANAAVVGNASRNVTIEWSSVQGATQYRLEVWPVNNVGATTTYDINAPTTTRSLTLAAGQIYNYRVYSICGPRLSDPSRIREFTVAAARATSASPSSLYVVYPNPNTGQFWILLEADRAEQGRLVISDLAGRAVYTGTLDIAPGPNEFFIDPGNLTPGVYMVTLTLAGRSETARVVVQ